MPKLSAKDIDLSQLLTPGVNFAVRCNTEEEAKTFVAAVAVQFPHKIAAAVYPGHIVWNNDNGGREGGRAYFPNLNDAEGGFCLLSDSVEWAVTHGYQIIYFEDMLQSELIEESDMPLSFLCHIAK